MLPGVQEFDLSLIKNKTIISALSCISPKVLKISFSSRKMSWNLSRIYRYQDLQSLTISSCNEGSFRPTDVECYHLKLPSLQYLEIAECCSMTFLGIQFLFTNLLELKHLTLLNWCSSVYRKGRYRNDFLSLARLCPPKLEHFLLEFIFWEKRKTRIDVGDVAEFWNQVRADRILRRDGQSPPTSAQNELQMSDIYPGEFDNGFLRANDLDEVIRLCNLDITDYFYGESSDDKSDDDSSSSCGSGDRDSDKNTFHK